VLDENSRRILLPPDGIVVSAKLAEILGARWAIFSLLSF
jgi:hypothetical protein